MKTLHSANQRALRGPSIVAAFVAVSIALGLSGLENQAGAECVFPPPGLVSWWSGEGSANEIFGGYPVTLMNGVTYVPGKVGQAFNFDGISNYVRLPDNLFPFPASGTGKTPFSFETWFRTTNSGVILGQTIAEPFGTTPSHVPAVYVGTGGRLRVQMFWNGAVDQVVSPSIVNDGAFHHLAVTYDGTTESVFLDGVSIGAKPLSQRGYSETYHYQLGTGYTSSRWSGGNDGWFSFKGQIDEPSLYNRALSSNEVYAIHASADFGKCKPPTPANVIYSNDFEGPLGLEWSDRDPAFSLWNNTFLGEFGNKTVVLTIPNLPPHTNLTLAFDLFLLNTWDGLVGPDLIDVSVEGGPTLLHSTFQNGANGGPQSYPAPHRANDFPAQTGALEVDTLDYSPDSVYRLRHTFAHAATNRVRLRFQGSGLQGLADESWGLDNVMVYPDGPTVQLLSPTSLVLSNAPTAIVLNATSAATTGALRYVQFLANNVILGTISNSPYTMGWSNLSGGMYVIKARAVDDAGRTSDALGTVQIGGLLGEYFATTNFSGTRITRLDPSVNFNWQSRPPIVGAPQDMFSVRWTGEIEPRYSEIYTLECRVSDGVRLWVDGQRVIDDWHVQGATTDRGTFAFEANRRYRVQMDYFEETGSALVWLNWSSASHALEVVPPNRLFPPAPGINRPPNIPVITVPPANGLSVTPGIDLPLSVDFFSDPDTGDAQTIAEWQIFTLNPSNLVWVSSGGANLLSNRLGNGVFFDSHTGLSGLLLNQEYLLLARHRDATSWSDWAERRFNTRPPEIVGPYVTPPYRTNVILIGDGVVLGVAVANTQPSVTYQWQRNGAAIAGATTTTLVLSNFEANLAGDYRLVASNPAGSTTSAPLTLTPSYLQLCGTAWDDRNADGVLNLPLIRGDNPDIVFVIDRSHSTIVGKFVGDPVGDINGDGIANSRLDAELAGFIALNNALIAHGETTNTRVAVVDFGKNATANDLNPALSGVQLVVAPNADVNGNGTNDIEEVLRSIHTNSVGGTDYHLPLLVASNVFRSLGSSNNGNLVFLSDGECDLECIIYTNDVAALTNAGIYLRAFGAGSNAKPYLSYLRALDGNAQIFTKPEQLVEFFGGPTGSFSERERGLAGITLYLDLNNNGQFDAGEPTAVSTTDDPSTPDEDETGRYCFGGLTAGPKIVRELLPFGFASTYPVTTADSGYVVSEVHVPVISGLDFGLARRATLGLLSVTPGAVALSFSRLGGINHRIEVSVDLQNWSALTNLSGANPVVTFTDPATNSAPRRFYRAVQR